MGDSRQPSRFRPNHALNRAESGPTTSGLCRYCQRQMWTATGDQTGLVRVSRDSVTCVTCVSWQQDNPGLDPRRARGTTAEQIPAEWTEDDPRWRADPDLGCAGAPTELFAPDPDPDELDGDDAARRAVWDERRRIARRVCAPCPRRGECLQTAHEHGYEGLWGGVFFDFYWWRDLETDRTGPTINVKKTSRHRESVA